MDFSKLIFWLLSWHSWNLSYQIQRVGDLYKHLFAACDKLGRLAQDPEWSSRAEYKTKYLQVSHTTNNNENLRRTWGRVWKGKRGLSQSCRETFHSRSLSHTTWLALMGALVSSFSTAVAFLLSPLTTTLMKKRIHFFELHDLDICPAWIRNFTTDALAFIWWLGDNTCHACRISLTSFCRWISLAYKYVAPLIQNGLQKTRSKKIIDLCSGAGGYSLTSQILPLVVVTIFAQANASASEGA